MCVLCRNILQCLSALLRKLKSHELNDTDNEKVQYTCTHLHACTALRAL